MLHQDKSHPGFSGQVPQQLLKRLDAARRSADRDYGERVVRRLIDVFCGNVSVGFIRARHNVFWFVLVSIAHQI